MAIGLGLHCKLRYIFQLLRLYINVFYSIHLLAIIWHLITMSIIIITFIIIIIIIFCCCFVAYFFQSVFKVSLDI